MVINILESVWIMFWDVCATWLAPRIFPICSPEEATLVGESQSQYVDFGQLVLTDFTENHSVYNRHRLWYSDILSQF